MQQLRARHQFIERAPLQQRRRVDTFAAGDQPFCARRADQTGAQRQALPHQVHADVDFGILHETVVGADAEIERGGDTRTAAHRRAVPCRDRDLIDVVQRVNRRARRCGCAVGATPTVRGIPSPGSFRSAPDEKCLPAPVKITTRVCASSRNDSATCFDLREVCIVQRVGAIRAIERDDGNRPALLDRKMLVAHLAVVSRVMS